MNTYFMTGATGVLGSAIVQKILKDTSDKLILLIRAEDEDILQKRVKWLFDFLEIDLEDMEGRVDCIRGDVELENLGLSIQLFMSLGVSVTHIIHSAASVRMNLPLERARRAAVTATNNILQLAQLCKQNNILQKVEMVSTVGVGGRWTGQLPEKWINEPRNFHNTYEQSKAEAEEIIEKQLIRGVPITVHRPSMIVGDSITGRIPYFQIFYYLIEFIVGRRTYGLLPDLSHQYVDLIPVDYVAQVIIQSSLTSQSIGKVLHLCSGPQFSVSLEKLKIVTQKKLRERNVDIPRNVILPYFLFDKFIKLIAFIKTDKKRKSIAMLSIFMDYLKDKQEFSNTETLHLVEEFGLKLPRADDFLDPVLDYYIDHVYTPTKTLSKNYSN